MPLNYSFIPEQDFSGGIDQHSAEANISARFVEDALNVDIEGKRLTKRKGYQPHAGCIPMRVQELVYEPTTNEIQFYLDDSLDLSVILDTPIVVFGRTSITGSGGDFSSTDTGVYYDSISTDPRKVLSGADTTITDAGFLDQDFLVGVTQSTSSTTYDNETVTMDRVEVLDTSYNVKLTHTLTPDPLSSFVYYLDTTSSIGSVWNEVYGTVVDGATVNHSITAATHNLDNFNIMVFVKARNAANNGFEYFEVDTVTIDTAGQVDIQFTNNSGLDLSQVTFILVSAPSANLKEGSFGASIKEIIISNISDPFLFNSLYQEDLETGDLTLVKPDTIVYDAEAEQLTITVTVGVSASFKFFFSAGFTQTNVIKVTPYTTVTSLASDETPQMTVWGICHDIEGVYGPNKIAREGWVNHLDSYKSAGEQRLIAGLGGNLFSSKQRTEVDAAYKIPELLTNLRNRVNVDTLVGPLFRGTGTTTARSRGYVNCSNGASNYVTIDQVEYQETGLHAGTVKYTLTCTGYEALDSTGTPTTLAAIVSTTTSLEDFLTTQQCGYSRHNGTFKILDTEEVDANTLVFYVDNPLVDSTDYDEVDVGGLAGVFTDQIPMDTESYFIPGDELVADLFTSTNNSYEVISSTSSVVVVENVVSALDIPVGLRINGKRTSCTIPLRDTTQAPTVTNFVAGDTAFLAGYERAFNIEYVNTKDDESLSITGDGSTATATMTGGGTTSHLFAGQRVILIHAEGYTGVQTITAITSATAFQFASTETASVSSGELQGKTVCLGEAIEWEDLNSDTNTLTVERRWIPLEAPDDNFDITPEYRVSHFKADPYYDQSFIRSTMASDNLYLTNGYDTVKKHDGISLYRSGLPRWQAGLFASVKPGSGIVLPLNSASYKSVHESAFVLDNTSQGHLQAGDKIYDDTNGQYYTIRRINVDKTDQEVLVDRTIDTSTGTTGDLKEISLYRYYFRLNMVDANNNIIASAVTGHEDFYVELAETSEVELKVVGFPPIDNYDFDRIELEIYRTKRNQSAPFYRIVTLPMDFDQGEGYLTYTDSTEDDALYELDPVNSALLGQEIGTGWEEPMRARYITSAGNRSCLANLTDYPQIDLVVDGIGAKNSSFDGLIWQFDRTATIGSTTDNINTIKFETRTTGEEVVTGYAAESSTFIETDIDTGTDAISLSAHGMETGDVVEYSLVSGTAPFLTGGGSLVSGQYYYVIKLNDNFIQLALTEEDALSGVYIDFSGAPSSTNKFLYRSFFIASIADTSTLSADNWTYFFHKGTPATDASLEFAGWFQIISIIDANRLRLNHSYSTTPTGTFPTHLLLATNPEDVPVYLNDSTATDIDSNYQIRGGQPFGSRDEKNVMMMRLANAINSTQRKCETVGFTPWLTAHADGSYGQGQLIVREPTIEDSSFYFTTPSTSAFNMYLNGARTSSDTTSASLTRVYPSRVIVSYPNYPEIFDSPTAILPQDSDSVIDVNSSDGQQITGIIPFYGDSAFGAGQKEDTLVVFKEHSIYLVSLANKAAGLNDNVVKKLESRGLGCTAPYSIVSAKDSIFFANDTGIYRLNRADMSVEFVGQMMERRWSEDVNGSLLDIFHGHHYAIGKQYKLSVVTGEEVDVPNEVYVYHHHTEEQQGATGGWTRYDSHDAVGWANLAADAFFATTGGRVHQIRNSGSDSDYRDVDSAIVAQFDSRALDFGAPGIRKILAAIMTHYRVPSDIDGTSLMYSYDLRDEFLPTDSLKLSRDATDSGLGDIVSQKGKTVRSSLDRKRAVYFQVRYQNSSIDEPLDVAGFTVKLAGLADKGIVEAKST